MAWQFTEWYDIVRFGDAMRRALLLSVLEPCSPLNHERAYVNVLNFLFPDRRGRGGGGGERKRELERRVI